MSTAAERRLHPAQKRGERRAQQSMGTNARELVPESDRTVKNHLTDPDSSRLT
jgi:hypothetical protein